MTLLPYTARVDAFTNPAGPDSPLHPDAAYTPDQICCEMSRLVHAPFEHHDRARNRIEQAMGCAGFTAFRYFWAKGTEGFAAHRPADGVLAIAFRGTELGMVDIVTDLKTWSEPWRPDPAAASMGRVHSGFAAAARLIWPQVEAALNELPHSRLWFTGHSLGAALATLAASRRAPELLCTFGSPRVGNPDFAAAMSHIRVRRHVHCADLICEVPFRWMGFSHVGGEIYIDRAGTVHNVIDPARRREDRSRARIEYLARLFIRHGWVPARDIADHAPINYVSALLGLRP